MVVYCGKDHQKKDLKDPKNSNSWGRGDASTIVKNNNSKNTLLTPNVKTDHDMNKKKSLRPNNVEFVLANTKLETNRLLWKLDLQQ
jgi:hypothetical protein